MSADARVPTARGAELVGRHRRVGQLGAVRVHNYRLNESAMAHAKWLVLGWEDEADSGFDGRAQAFHWERLWVRSANWAEDQSAPS